MAIPRFICSRCGACCRWPGPVRITADEADRIAALLNLAVSAFIQRHTVLAPDRRTLSLKEKPDGSCEFLDDQGACVLQSVKPQQCRDFPTGWNFPGYDKHCRGRWEPAT